MSKPKIYVHQEEDGAISISRVSVEDPDYEANHIMLYGLRPNGMIDTHDAVLNIVRNVLFYTGEIDVVME